MPCIPLADAVIAANSPLFGHEPALEVLREGDPRSSDFDILLGAGEARWSAHPDHRLGMLHEILWHLAHVHRIPTEVIHAATQSIAEYLELEGNEYA